MIHPHTPHHREIEGYSLTVQTVQMELEIRKMVAYVAELTFYSKGHTPVFTGKVIRSEIISKGFRTTAIVLFEGNLRWDKKTECLLHNRGGEKHWLERPTQKQAIALFRQSVEDAKAHG